MEPPADHAAPLRITVLRAGLSHLPHLVVLAGLGIAALALLGPDAERLNLDVSDVARRWLTMLPVFLALAALAAFLWLRHAGRLGLELVRAFTSGLRREQVEILLLRVPLALALTAGTSWLYFTFKVNIPRFGAFTWDPFFTVLDRLLLLGHDGWAITHALLPWIWATVALDRLYLFWYLILFAAILFAGILPLRHPLRLAFLLALALDWVIGGVIIAILLPAAGPVYVERILGDPTFRPLTELLAAQSAVVPLWALDIQEWLWRGYVDPDLDPAGISAFPSLHLAVLTTVNAFAWAAGRLAGKLLVPVTALTLVASVHLGWHYLVDGLAGIALGLAAWWASRAIIGSWLRASAPLDARLAAAGEPVAAE